MHTYTHALLWSLRRLQYHLIIKTYLKTSHDRFTFFQYSFAAATIKSSFASPHSTDRHLVQWELRLVMLPVFKDNVKNFKVAPCFNSVYDMSHPSKRAMETINVTVVAMDRNKCRAIACIKNRIQCRRTWAVGRARCNVHLFICACITRAARVWTTSKVHSTCMPDNHIACMYYDPSTGMLYDQSACMYYDHSTCMYYDHSTYIDHTTCT